MGGTHSTARAAALRIMGPDPSKLQAYAPVRDPFNATPAERSGPAAASALRRGDGREKTARPGLEVDRGARKTRVKVGIAGATPRKQLILPAIDTDCACSTFVRFTPPRAPVVGPHEWDYGRVHALLGTGEIASHMKMFTGFAELLFVACAQSAPPRESSLIAKKGNREPPVKILVAVATTGWCWLMRGGLHTLEVSSKTGCCASRPVDELPKNRYSRSSTGWERVRQSFHVDELESISASDSVALPGCDLLEFNLKGGVAPLEVSLDPEAAGLLLCHLRSLRVLSDGLPYGGDSFSIRGEKTVHGVARWAPPEPRSPEKALFACLVTKLSALSQDWVHTDGLGLSQLLDSGGDSSPTFRGTPKRLDIVIAETLCEIQHVGRVDPDAECWKILPLLKLAPSLARGHLAFCESALDASAADEQRGLTFTDGSATKVRTDLLENNSGNAMTTIVAPSSLEQELPIDLGLRLSMRKLPVNEVVDTAQDVQNIEFLECKLDRMLYVDVVAEEHEQCPAMFVVMEEARQAIRRITAQTGRSVVAEPFEVLPDSREAELAVETLEDELARSPTDRDLKVKLDNAKQEVAEIKRRRVEEQLSKEHIEWAMYAVMGPSEAQRCGASPPNVFYHGVAENTPAWKLGGDTQRLFWDICTDCAASGKEMLEVMWRVRQMTDIAQAHEYDKCGATESLCRTAVDVFKLQAANAKEAASNQ